MNFPPNGYPHVTCQDTLDDGKLMEDVLCYGAEQTGLRNSARDAAAKHVRWQREFPIQAVQPAVDFCKLTDIGIVDVVFQQVVSACPIGCKLRIIEPPVDLSEAVKMIEDQGL